MLRFAPFVLKYVHNNKKTHKHKGAINIIQIFEKFSTQESCIHYLEEIRWKGTPTCPYCKSTKTAQLGKRCRCYNCITSFSVTVGTIFHKTKIPLQKWFLAISLILNAKMGSKWSQACKFAKIGIFLNFNLFQFAKMSRKTLLYDSGTLYHLILRGNGGQHIFFDDSDSRRFYQSSIGNLQQSGKW